MQADKKSESKQRERKGTIKENQTIAIHEKLQEIPAERTRYVLLLL